MNRAERAPHLALVAVCLGYFMTILDTTIVNVALEDMARQLGADLAGLQWIVDGYALTFASVLLTAGALGDRFGNRRLFIGGLVLFTAASGLCGASPSLRALLAFRVLQGLGAAFLVPASLALLRQSFEDSRERARAIGWWAAVAGLAAASGPVIGGLLISALGWRSIFWVNLPVGLIAIFLSFRWVPSVPERLERRLDFLGQCLGMLGLGGLTFVLIEGRSLGWGSSAVVLVLAGVIASFILFVWVERRVKHPMLPLDLFRQGVFSAANAVGLLLNFGFYGELFVLSLYYQRVRGDSPFQTGLALLPQTGVLLFGNIVSGRWTSRSGARAPMASGLILGAAGFLSLAWVRAHTAYLWMVWPLFAIGFGTALTMPAMTTAIIDVTPPERTGMGSGILNASRQVGGVLGIALLGTFLHSPGHFLPGMHTGMMLAGVSFGVGTVLTLAAVR